MRSVADIVYSENTPERLDLHLPDSDTFPVFVYFHGGGFTGGDKGRHPVFYEYMTSRGIAVASVNYRMYPSAQYPDFIVDCAAAVAWVAHNIGSYGNCTGVFVGGSSAGGYASQLLCFDESWLTAAGVDPDGLAGFVHDAGQPTAHFKVLKERGIDPRRVIVDETAPLYHVKDGRNYPPMLVIVSDEDMENRYEQTMLLISTLGHFGYKDKVEFKLMHGKHCRYLDAVDENGVSVFGQTVAPFIESKI